MNSKRKVLIYNTTEYLTKRKVNPDFKENIQKFVTFDEELPLWNYRFSPPS